jgi:hypothetical protein
MAMGRSNPHSRIMEITGMGKGRLCLRRDLEAGVAEEVYNIMN